MSEEQVSDFVRDWIGSGDPTGLATRGEVVDKPWKPEPEEVKEPSELILARESEEE